MPKLDLTKATRIKMAGGELARLRIGSALWIRPVISITSGTGYAGSVYTSTVAGQWYANDVAISGYESATTYTQTVTNEPAAIRCGASNIIQMWTPAALNSSYKTNGVWLSFDKDMTLAAGKIAAAADLFGVRPYSQATATAQFTASTISGHLAGVVTAGVAQSMAPVASFAPLWWAVVAGYGAGTETAFATYNQLVGTGTSVDGLRGNLSAATMGGGSGFYVNGTATATLLPSAKSIIAATPTAGGTAYKWPLGLGRQTAWGWSGPIYEALALGAVPDTATRQQIEGYLAHAQGLSASLPAAHPYKSAAPQVIA